MIPYVESTYSFVRLCAGQGETDVSFLDELHVGGGAEETRLRLLPARTVELMVANPTGAKVQVKISYNKDKVYESQVNGKTYMTVDAPVQQGDVLGKATFLLEGKELATVDVLAEKSIDVNTLLELKLMMASFLGIDTGDFWGSTAGIIARVILTIVGIWAFFALAYFVYNKVLVWYKKRNMGKMVDKNTGNDPKNVNKL